MIEYLKLHVTDEKNESFLVELRLIKEKNTYWILKGEGKRGIFIMCNDSGDNENGVVYGKIHNANNLSDEIIEFVKPFGRGQKKFPYDFE